MRATSIHACAARSTRSCTITICPTNASAPPAASPAARCRNSPRSSLRAALIYLLGGDLTGKPTYTTLFLDEALIKADGRYTKRALTVLPRLGFQIIVSAPESKTAEILSIADKAYVAYKDPATGNSYLQELDREPATQAETQDATVEQTQPATEA